jgi:hypothetical protein|tara:strand:- start:1048 stop:1380 length:333 start_codon:yes stop_codon:yes gene_type:complete
MPLPSYHNVSNEAPVVLLKKGNGDTPSYITITNTNASNSTLVDVYIRKAADSRESAASYYILKNKFLHTSETINIDFETLKINNFDNGYSLLIKLTGVGTTSPTVDALII